MNAASYVSGVHILLQASVWRHKSFWSGDLATRSANICCWHMEYSWNLFGYQLLVVQLKVFQLRVCMGVIPHGRQDSMPSIFRVGTGIFELGGDMGIVHGPLL